MAIPVDIVRYPLMAYNFRVVIGIFTMSFTEVSGLERKHDTATYSHGLSFWEGERIVKYHVDKHIPITLKRGVMVPGNALLYAWLEMKREVMMLISLCDTNGLPLVNWHIARAMLVKLTGPTLDASSSQVAIDTLEVMAAGITVGAPVPIPFT